MYMSAFAVQEYEKVGRLKADEERNCIRVIVDGQGEIGTITREGAEELLAGVEPQPVLPSGTADLSISGAGLKVRIPSSDGGMLLWSGMSGICWIHGHGRKRRCFSQYLYRINLKIASDF